MSINGEMLMSIASSVSVTDRLALTLQTPFA